LVAFCERTCDEVLDVDEVLLIEQRLVCELEGERIRPEEARAE